ncbi:hypothetical protein CASFOL_035671 [Castilleja foliolosa]|uniref:MADS-box domain-containing protein n=1 Tax=Castilleja foliolosa TaxID=1961234 RepID=A0ABD3BTY3_9LAMI
MSSSRQPSRPRAKQGRHRRNIKIPAGSEYAVIALTKDNEAYTFANPDVKSVVRRFLAVYPPPTDISGGSTDGRQSSNLVQKENEEKLAQLEKQLEVEMARKKELDREKKIIDDNVAKMSYEELEVLKGKLIEFKKSFEAAYGVKRGENP